MRPAYSESVTIFQLIGESSLKSGFLHLASMACDSHPYIRQIPGRVREEASHTHFVYRPYGMHQFWQRTTRLKVALDPLSEVSGGS